jgi:flagellar biosynthesis protein FlhA
MQKLGKYGNVGFSVFVVGMLLLMVLPVPTPLLDVLLAVNITISLIVLLVSIYLPRSLEFSSFPALLLVTTLFRLTLNIATTRLILIKGGEGPEAAGHIVKTFGDFVVGGNYVVGVIIFVILVIINFVVITKGSGRIAEVGARFTLDAMPGKQMAIDADLNSGLITEDQARARRTQVEREADFYGAMDGASKFVRGDAIAGIMITVVNIIGGFIIGMTQHGMTARDAAATYTILSVGDGLVSQIPALVLSTAAGIIVSRAGGTGDMGGELYGQLFSNKRVLNTAAVMVSLFGLVPGMPLLVFGGIGFGLYTLARRIKDPDAGPELATAGAGAGPGGKVLPGAGPGGAGAAPDAPALTEQQKIEALLPIDMLELEVGYALIPMVDRNQNGELLDRIQSIRRQFASQMGVIVPPIHIRDNLQLPPGGYSVLIKGVEVAHGELLPDRFMAMNPGEVIGTVPGVETVEPAFGLPAIWITADHKDRAEQLGYTVVDCSTVVATHLSEVLKENAQELLGRQELQELLDIFAKQAPKVVEDLIPEKLPLGEVLRVMKNLLKEQISVRDMRTILEGIADHVHLTRNPEIITEFVRQRMAKYITSKLKGMDNQVHVLTVAGELEEHFRQHIQQIDGDFHLTVEPRVAENFLKQLEERMQMMTTLGYQPVLLVPPELRRPVRNLIDRFVPGLTVVSHKEIAHGAQVASDGEVGAGIARATPRARVGAQNVGQMQPGMA